MLEINNLAKNFFKGNLLLNSLARHFHLMESGSFSGVNSVFLKKNCKGLAYKTISIGMYGKKISQNSLFQIFQRKKHPTRLLKLLLHTLTHIHITKINKRMFYKLKKIFKFRSFFLEKKFKMVFCHKFSFKWRNDEKTAKELKSRAYKDLSDCIKTLIWSILNREGN